MGSNVLACRSIATHALGFTELVVAVILSLLLISDEVLIELLGSVDTERLHNWVSDDILLIEETCVTQVELVARVVIVALLESTTHILRRAPRDEAAVAWPVTVLYLPTVAFISSHLLRRVEACDVRMHIMLLL